jgi:tetratricopeptide (TPR) repeat protein
MQDLLSSFWAPIGIISGIFWCWMFYDCLQRGQSDRQTWMMVLLYLNVIGAFIYFFKFWLPRNSRSRPNSQSRNSWGFGSGRLKDALWQAEADVRNIGKSYQYLKLANILYEIGDLDKALEAYGQALEREPGNIQALWGAAQLEINRQNFEKANSHLKLLLKQEPNFSFGEASLTYGKVLFQIGELDATVSHMNKHLQNWSHPEAYITLAHAYQGQSEIAKAIDSLETMISKVKNSTPLNYRMNQDFVRQGERMLRVLEKSK